MDINRCMKVWHSFLLVWQNTNQMVMNCLFFLPGHAHDEGHASHNSTCSSGAQGPYPQIHYPAAHHYTRSTLFLIKTTRVLNAWLGVLDTSRAKQAAGKQKACLVFLLEYNVEWWSGISLMLLVNERAKESVTKETAQARTWLVTAVFMSVLWSKMSDLFPLAVFSCSVSATHWQDTLYKHSLNSRKIHHPITSSHLKHLPSVFAATYNPQCNIWGGTLVPQRNHFQWTTRNICTFFQVIKT